MKKFILALLAVFAIGGGNLWAQNSKYAEFTTNAIKEVTWGWGVTYKLTTPLVKDKTYVLTLKAKCSDPSYTNIAFWPYKNGGETCYTGFGINSEWVERRCEFKANDDLDRLVFNFGQMKGRICMDDIRLVEKDVPGDLVNIDFEEGSFDSNWDFDWNRPTFYKVVEQYNDNYDHYFSMTTGGALANMWDWGISYKLSQPLKIGTEYTLIMDSKVTTSAEYNSLSFWPSGDDGTQYLGIGISDHWETHSINFTAEKAINNLCWKFGNLDGTIDIDNVKLVVKGSKKNLITSSDFEGGCLPAGGWSLDNGNLQSYGIMEGEMKTDEYKTVQQLVSNKFYMVTKKVFMPQFGKNGVAMTIDNPAIVTNDASSFCQFQAEPITVDGTEYWYLHAFKANGDKMYGWWGDGREKNDCINPSLYWGDFEMAQGAANASETGKIYGGAYELGALFTIEYSEGNGFSFKTAAKDGNGNPLNKYIGADGKQSDSPCYWHCYNINYAKYSELEEPQDYLELPIEDLVATGSATVNGEVIDMTNGGGAKWQYAIPQDWSAYRYLVIAPKRRFVTSAQKDAGADAERTAIQVSINGKSLQWIGEWNPKRLCVFDLTTTMGDPGLDLTTVSDAITSVEISCGYNERGEWSLSAAYLTNTRPTYEESRYNHDAGALGEAETKADHVRTLSAQNTLGVVCLPYASAICGADAFEFVGVDDAENPDAIWVRPVTGLLTACKPYVFFTNTNLNVTFYKAGANTVAEPASENGLVGVFAETQVTGNKYAVSGGKFVQAGEYTATVKENRAYLDIEKAPVYAIPAAEAHARGFINILDEGDVTIIKSVEKHNGSNVFYDINGRRIQAPTRGLYIVDGKKYFVK